MKRNTLPELSSRKQMLRARRERTERVVFAVMFTAVELWAIVAMVVLLDDDGVLAVAASVVLSAALIAVWDTRKNVPPRGSNRNTRRAWCGSDPGVAAVRGRGHTNLGRVLQVRPTRVTGGGPRLTRTRLAGHGLTHSTAAG